MILKVLAMANPTILVFGFAHLLFLCTCLCQMIHAADQIQHSGLSIKLIDRYSPESPLFQANLTNDQIMKELIQISNVRANSLANLVEAGNSSLDQPPHLEDIIRPTIIGPQMFMYLVQVGIGTFDSNPPYRTYYLAIDTGSDLLWTQCEGCNPNCFHQVYPVFPKGESRSFHPLPCNSCPPRTYCQHNGCMAGRKYGDGSSVIALVAKETLTFESNGFTHVAVPNIVFGCGINVQNFKEGRNPDNKISGLLGMNFGSFSFQKQAQSLTQGKFSYCLQPFNSPGSASPMFLRFGNDVILKPQMQTTELVQVPNSINFYLNLQGLSVAGKRLDIPPEVFKIRGDGTGGCIIDSGSAVSYVAKEAYQVLADGITNYMLSENPNVRKMDEPELGFSLCFERFKDPEQVMFPSVTFHFEIGEFQIQPLQSFYLTPNKAGHGMQCLTIFETSYKSMTILGAYQQVNQRIVYDTNDRQLHFMQDDCSMAN